jgi:hypothetical protein
MKVGVPPTILPSPGAQATPAQPRGANSGNLVSRFLRSARQRRSVLRRQSALLLLLVPVTLLVGAEPAAPSDPAPAVNWVLPIFTDKEGYRSMTLRGTEVRTSGRNIAVTDLNITIFSGDAEAQVDSILLSPAAVFLPKEKRAHGDKSVRFIRDDIEVVGTGWTYDYETKKISLQKDVRVTFRAQLNDILK